MRDFTNRLRRIIMWAAGLGCVIAAQISTPAWAHVASTAAPSAAGPSTPSPGYSVVHNVGIRMSDGVVLRADEYLPHHGCPCTPVLTFTPYGKDQSTTIASMLDPSLMADGYAQIMVDVRGTGASGGIWDMFAAREQKDYAEVVRWAAKLPFGTGRVAAFGESYSAIAALLMAEQPGTRALKALFLRVPDGDQYRDIFSGGGNANVQFLTLWADGVITPESEISPVADSSNSGVDYNAATEHLFGSFLQTTAPATLDTLMGSSSSALPGALQAAPPWDGPWYRVRSPLTHIARIHIPVFIEGGEYDLFQRSEPLLYQSLRLPISKKKLVLTPGFHLTVPNYLNTTDSAGRRIYSEGELSTRWFDRWIKGRRNGMADFPTFEDWYRGVDRYIETPANGPRQTWRRWYLNARPSHDVVSLYDGGLATSPGLSGSATVLYNPASGICSHDPVQYLFGEVNSDGCSDNETINDEQGVTFTSGPVRTPTVLYGPSDLHLWLKTTGREANVVAIVSDVAPDGVATQLSFGGLFASNRAVDTRACRSHESEDCSGYGGGQIIRPFHPFTAAAQRPVTPGETMNLQVEIKPLSDVLLPGHRLRISLFTADTPSTTPTLSLLENAAASTDTYLFGPGDPAYLYIGQDIGTSRTAVLAPPR